MLDAAAKVLNLIRGYCRRLVQILFFESAKLDLIDIGAIWGLNPRWSGLININCCDFEPRLGPVGQLDENVSNDVAIWHSTERRKMYITRKGNCSSLREPNYQNFEFFNKRSLVETVSAVSLDCIALDDMAISKAHVLKIDAQGCSHDILQGARELIRTINILEVEVEFLELYKGQKLFNDVFDDLAKKGFTLVDIMDQKRWGDKGESKAGNIVYGDAIFINKEFLNFSEAVDIRASCLALCVYGKFFQALRVVRDALSANILDRNEAKKLTIGIRVFEFIS